MREIKFRTWDVDAQEMLYPSEVNCEEPLMSHWVMSEGKDYHLEQYTGLKDKNGVEIYEGDVLKTPIYPWAKVHYWEDGFYLETFDSTALPLWDYGRDAEVIGNIHENPEMVDAT